MNATPIGCYHPPKPSFFSRWHLVCKRHPQQKVQPAFLFTLRETWTGLEFCYVYSMLWMIIWLGWRHIEQYTQCIWEMFNSDLCHGWFAQIGFQYGHPGFVIWQWNVNQLIQTARSQNSSINDVWSVRGSNYKNIFFGRHAIHFCQQLVDDPVSSST